LKAGGRGIEKIYDACREDGVPEPEYTVHPGDIMIKFTFPDDRIIYSKRNKVHIRVTDGVTDIEMLILNYYQKTLHTHFLNLLRKRISVERRLLEK